MSSIPLRSPSELIAVVPYLLGFHPADSLVVVAMRDRQVVFVARHDLPPAGEPARALAASARYLARLVARQHAERATVIGFGPADRVTRLIDALGAALPAAGMPVDDLIRVTDGRWWSYTCAEPTCCPPDGVPIGPAANLIAAAATYAGEVALPDRDALARTVAPVDGPAREAIRAATARAERRLAALDDQALLDAGRAALNTAVDRPLTDDEVARLTLLLRHAPVAELAWRTATATPEQLTLWTDITRRAHLPFRATPACLLAYTAWRAGHGALASLALDQALHTDPTNATAQTLHHLLTNGIGPDPAVAA